MPDPKKQTSKRAPKSAPKSAPTSAAKPAGKPLEQARPRQDTRDFDDPVNEASDESFPASDPPSWTDTAATKNGN